MDKYEYDAKWDAANNPTRHTKQLEEQGSGTTNSPWQFSGTPSYDAERGALLTAESEGDSIPGGDKNQPVIHKGRAARLGNLFTSKKLRGKSSLIAVMLLIFGGATFMTILTTPSLAIVEMKEVFTKGLNDQLKAVDNREASLLRSKLKGITTGGCGVAIMPCKFQTISETFAKKLEDTKKIKVDRVPATDLRSKLTNRSEIKGMTFFDDNGNQIASAGDARELTSLLQSNSDVRAAMLEGYNPLFMTLKDKVAQTKMRLLKVSENLKTTGQTDEERQKSVDAAVGGEGNSGAQDLIHTKDKNGNDVYTDSNGNPVSSSEVKAMQDQSNRISAYSNAGGTSGVLKTAIKGAGALAAGVGTLDTACTVFNTIRYTNSLAKTVKASQAARFAMAMILTPADSIKAGIANEGDINFVGNNLTATKPAAPVLDESKLNDPSNAQNPATITDPTTGENAFDSAGYRAAAYGDVTNLSLSDSRFMIGGGNVGVVDNALAAVARVVNFGNPDPKQVSAKCKYIQNPAVRFGALAVGILAGAGSFGVLTAVGIGASLAISLTLPMYESQIADMLAGDVFKGISGYDSGNAGMVGSSVVFGDIAQGRGMEPVTGSDGIQYLNASQQTYDAYVDTERYIARNTPLDITNQYSFLGTIATNLVPFVERSKASASAAMMNMASLIPTSFASLVPSAKALADDAYKPAYFNQCHDPAYEAVGIKAGEFCDVHYWMSDTELNMDPVQNAQWMVDNNEIDPNSTTGDASQDNSNSWNYQKFLSECVNRTVGWGENQDENSGDGSDCISPANEAKNEHYRVYTMDKSIEDSMDDNLNTAPTPGSSDFSDGKTAPVSTTGWAYPTNPNLTITNGYNVANGTNHPGVEIAAGSDSATKGQPVFAAYKGKVIAAGPSQDYCNWIVIEHDVDGQTYNTVYGNLPADGIIVHEGQSVNAGDEIGHLGVDSTDPQCVKKPYLYFELWQGSAQTTGFRIDPTPTLNAAKKSPGVTNV